jgi:hypothetical protein
MNVPKHVAGLALFILIVSVSVFINKLLAAPSVTMHIPPVPLGAPLNDSPFRTVRISQPFSYNVRLVSLDFINRRSYTTLTLKRETKDPWPDELWVDTSFFIPSNPAKSWSGAPVRINVPRASGDEISLTAIGDCPRCQTDSAPRSGYYARVSVSSVSAEAATVSNDEMNRDIETATPVLVQVDRKTRP